MGKQTSTGELDASAPPTKIKDYIMPIVKCKACNGTGKVDGWLCRNCKGTCVEEIKEPDNTNDISDILKDIFKCR
jgi:DnaJ-class molecular chaperone